MDKELKFEYKNYICKAEFYDDEKIYYGRVINIRPDCILVEGKSPTAVEKDFKQGINEYVDLCKKLKLEPNPPLITK
jgi:predicted HicB family RNase H-like nuclease